MTEPETARPDSEPASPVSATAKAPETGTASEPTSAPPPEPWTPERVIEWNAYYDLYVALGLVLLVFVVGANKISNSSLWTQLRCGQLMLAQGRPLTADPFSYTETGRRWVNIPWLFEASHYGLYKAAYDLLFDKNDPGASAPKAEQLGVGVLVGLGAVARVLAALALLSIRRAGPGRWWSVVCVALALGAIATPGGVVLGGIAQPGQVAPMTWGLLFLAVEMLLIDRGLTLGKAAAAWGLVPLFLLWANIDESFLVGLCVLGASVVGLFARERAPEAAPLDVRRGLAVLAACAGVCFVNPSLQRIYPAAVAPLFALVAGPGEVRTLDQLSFFSPRLLQGDLGRNLVLMYVTVVSVGLASFAVNYRRFSVSRFLMYVVAAAFWGLMIRYEPEFAIVFAACLVLNGQEWYHDRFGTRGRLGTGWTVWSVGGRAVTIVLLFFFVAKGLTGYGSSLGELQFGFGFNPDSFDFEAADYLRAAPIKGKILNTTRQQGDALVWRAYPQRQVYIDTRSNLYPPSLLNELQQVRTALKADDKEKWQPLLDKYGISVVMLDEEFSRNTYKQLVQSPNWLPFYDDGNVILFGRTDAPASDLAVFRANRLEADVLAYRRTRPVPAVDRPPTQVGWLDEVFQARSLTGSQPHDSAANRWLKPPPDLDPNTPYLPDPAHNLMAIREARTALAKRPDDPLAFRILSECYRALMAEETALLQGRKLTPEITSKLAHGVAQPLLLMTRFRQRVTTLNYAIQTTPPPRTRQDRQNLQTLNAELFQLYMSATYLDLARDRLQTVAGLSERLELTPEAREDLARRLSQLNDVVRKIQDQMNEQQGGPLSRAAFALRVGAPGLAIQELEEADRTNLSPALVKPQLIDRYCDTGQPDKALELLSTGDPDDPNLGGDPGESAVRQARVYLLLGNYENAAMLFETRAIPQLRYDRTHRALSQAQLYFQGEPLRGTSVLLTVPDKVATQAGWEYELAACLLEGGIPLADANHATGAADHFAKALTLAPDLSLRPVIAYYLEKLGKPVPPEKPADQSGAKTEKK